MPQSYKSHTRWNIPFHLIASPILAANLVVRVGDLLRAPSGPTAWGAVVAFGIWLGVSVGRTQALTVQDRVIRLEETLRLQRLLPVAEHAGIAALTRQQFVALRFASDGELPALYRRVRNGEFAKPRDIKAAVTSWRPDTLRA